MVPESVISVSFGNALPIGRLTITSVTDNTFTRLLFFKKHPCVNIAVNMPCLPFKGKYVARCMTYECRTYVTQIPLTLHLRVYKAAGQLCRDLTQ